ncbi:thioesterase [Gulosibacter macacae]|uniref:Thioesterase n=1 Tax=Gulosibacter macacae TaxID=2488791 RepID=A0A3P3VWX5_9MICO|nr:thioesterase family protein [Gulosibacter macacae]RRJ85959.1 thioesterase [Gulosibacter macacae]
MKYYLRMLLVWWRARRAPAREMKDIGRIPFRVGIRDIDVLGHMNNGTFLTVQDLGRLDWMLRTRTLRAFQSRGWNAVVARQTIAYRRSLDFGVDYILETRFLGVDERNFYMEHRFVSGGQLCAQAFVVGRFISKNGVVPMAEMYAAIPELAEFHDLVPAWVLDWGEAARLPSAGSDVPSVWSNEPRA